MTIVSSNSHIQEPGVVERTADELLAPAAPARLVVRMSGGEEVDVDGTIEACFSAGAWVGAEQAGLRRNLHALYSAREPDFMGKLVRQFVLGIVADTVEESDRDPQYPALFVPNCEHVVFVTVPKPTVGGPKALAISYDAGEWRTPQGALIASLLPEHIMRVRKFASIAEADAELSRVRAALRYRMQDTRGDFDDVPESEAIVSEQDDVVDDSSPIDDLLADMSE